MEQQPTFVKERSLVVDAARGVAALLVVINHVATNNSTDFYNTMLWNFIWAVQMPLFFLISGYCVKFSKPPVTSKELGTYVKKRSIALLLPWLTWTVVIKGMLLNKGQDLSAYLKNILLDTQIGFWFLLSLWMIYMIFACASFFAARITKRRPAFGPAALLAFYFAGAILLGGGAYLISSVVFGAPSFTFLGAKITIYYMPMFAVGAAFGWLPAAWKEKPWYNAAKSWISFLLLAAFVVILNAYSLYGMESSAWSILLRYVAGIGGSVAIVSALNGIRAKESGAYRGLVWCGKHSLELYVVHVQLTAVIAATKLAPLFSLNGFGHFLLNLVLALGLSVAVIWLLSANRISRLLLFGKR